MLSAAKTDNHFSTTKRIGLVLGPLAMLCILLTPAPEVIGTTGWRVIAVAALMLTWWITEALPIPVTSLAPILFFPILGVMPLEDATYGYGHPIIFLFMGGFVIALAMERWGLHRRIALSILKLTGTKANGIVGGFMIATAFLSMWMSNTATTVMMLPIAISVLDLILDEKVIKNQPEQCCHKFALTLMLGVAFAANIGGTATLIGTPPNVVLAGFLQDRFGYTIDFANWILFGLPFAIIMLGMCWLLLVHVIYPNRLGTIEGANNIIKDEYSKLGPMSKGEKMVAFIFFGAASLWIFKPLLPFAISDTGVAIAAAMVFFVLPVNIRKAQFVLAWPDMKDLPWGILLLFGGGLSLAAAMDKSGLVQVIGQNVSEASVLGITALVLVTTLVVLLMTEFMSNVALIAIFLPVLAGISLSVGQNPLLFAIPATLASSCAFMLPMSTPPNAIVFASGHIRIPEMVRAGIILNIASILLITLFAFSLISWALEIAPKTIPAWAY